MLINNENEEENDRSEIQCDKVARTKERKKKKVTVIKVKGKVEDEKEIGAIRLFSVNCNGFGPCSQSKISQTKEISTGRNTNGLTISSSDVRWNVKNKTNMV